MIETEPTAIRGSGYDARLAVDTTPDERRSAYDANLQVDTPPVVRVESVTTSGADSSAPAGPGTSPAE